MATNAITLRRPSDRKLYLIAAAAFPLLVLAGYFRSYYFSAFFDVPPMAALVHAHGLVMTAWVIFFTVQIALVRTKNVKVHMSLGLVGIALATLAVVVGMATAYNAQLIHHRAPAGIDPYAFFLIPFSDLVIFVVLFAAAIYYRKRPAEHKSLMLMTAVNFLPAAVSRLAPVPEKYFMLWTFGVPDLLALAFFGWYTWKHGKVNRVFATALGLFIVSHPLRLMLMDTEPWIRFAGWLAALS